MKIEAFGIDEFPMIKNGDPIPEIVYNSILKKGLSLQDNDIIAVTEKIVAKSEGMEVDVKKMKVTEKAREYSGITGQEPELVQLILDESRDILGMGENFMLVETHHGLVTANAGIDHSNIEDGKVKLLPKNPDESARKIREYIENKTGKKIGVIITDSFGRPFRFGSVGVSIGVSGINALWNRMGDRDLFGHELKVTRVNVADNLAAFATMIMGEADEGIPVVLIRGFKFPGEGNTRDLLRPKENDIMRSGKRD